MEAVDSAYMTVEKSEPGAIAYEARFYRDDAGGKKSMHRGPALTIEVDGRRVSEYEVVIDGTGVPRFISSEADPVVPEFASSL
jgi:hypothetical protein